MKDQDLLLLQNLEEIIAEYNESTVDIVKRIRQVLKEYGGYKTIEGTFINPQQATIDSTIKIIGDLKAKITSEKMESKSNLCREYLLKHNKYSPDNPYGEKSDNN